MLRDILKIDEEKCNGCGLCVPNCHEGALQVIDGKVRLVSELMCDGLGACIGYCPEDAITIEKREAQPYDEITVISEMVHKGANTVIAHLKHLKDHREEGYLKEGMNWLEMHEKDVPFSVREVLGRSKRREKNQKIDSGRRLILDNGWWLPRKQGKDNSTCTSLSHGGRHTFTADALAGADAPYQSQFTRIQRR